MAGLRRREVLRFVLVIVLVLPLLALVTGNSLTHSSAPIVVSSCGYINRTPLKAHTTVTFDSDSASTLVAFVSSHPAWDGKPVSIDGVSDNKMNTWKVLTGPTTRIGSSFPMLSAVYYVNAPATGVTHQVTVHLTNPAPLVVHVFAVSESDVNQPPISSSIVDPGTGRTSEDVIAAPITVPANTLVLGWAKNETQATAAALDSYTLDEESTSFLWAESEIAPSAGSYVSHFAYDKPIGWQTAVVGIKLSPRPVASPIDGKNNAPFKRSSGYWQTLARRALNEKLNAWRRLALM